MRTRLLVGQCSQKWCHWISSVSRAQICPRVGWNRSSCRAIACFVPSERRGPHVCPGTRSLRRGTPEERKVKIVMGVPQRSSKDTSGKHMLRGCMVAIKEHQKMVESGISETFGDNFCLFFFHLFHSKTHWIRTQLDERSILMGHLLNCGEKKPGSCFSGTGPPVVEPSSAPCS